MTHTFSRAIACWAAGFVFALPALAQAPATTADQHRDCAGSYSAYKDSAPVGAAAGDIEKRMYVSLNAFKMASGLSVADAAGQVVDAADPRVAQVKAGKLDRAVLQAEVQVCDARYGFPRTANWR